MHRTPLLSTAEVAEIIGRSPATVSRLVSSGRLTAQRYGGGQNGGAMFFDPKEVAKLAIKLAAERSDRQAS